MAFIFDGFLRTVAILVVTLVTLAPSVYAVPSHWVLVRIPTGSDANHALPSVVDTRLIHTQCDRSSYGECAKPHSEVPVLCSAVQWMVDGDASASQLMDETHCMPDTLVSTDGFTVFASDGSTTVPMYFIEDSLVTQKMIQFHDDTPRRGEHKDTETHEHTHPHSMRPLVEVAVVLPDSFTHVAVKHSSASSELFHDEDESPLGTARLQRRLFRTAATPEEIMADRNITVTRHQDLDPLRTRTVTFLAGGYLASQKGQFLSDVDRAMSYLRSKSASMYDPAPWDRYFYLFNFYSVFEPSVQSGASRPQGPGYSCPSYMSDCGPTVTNNNLDCAFGTPTPSRLGCSYEKSKALASFAPATDIIVVLVNDKDYGGTGSDRFGCLSAGSGDLAFLMVHEIAHAVGGLGDEYTYGFNDNSGIYLPNCARTNVASQIPWKYWIDQGAVSASPSLGCSFNNYYRPTPSSCVMESGDNPSLCAVCKEALAVRMVTLGPSLNFAAPQCPYNGFDVYVGSTETVTLTVNHRFVLLNDDITITWTFPDGTTATGVPAVTVSGSALTTRTSTVTVVIQDGTPMVSPGNLPAKSTQTITYRLIRKTNADTGLKASTCVASTGVSYTYNGICTSSDECTRDTVISLYDAQISSAITEDDALTAVKASAIVFSVIGLIAIAVAVGIIVYRKKTNPQSVYEFSTAARGVWIAASVFSLFVLVVVCCAIVYIVRYLPETVMFGEALFIAGLVLAICIYLSALGTFCSVLTLSTFFNTIFSILTVLFAIGIFIVSMIIGDLAINKDDKDVIDKFAERWRQTVNDDPSLACTMQNYFGCSGYYYACVPVLSEYCPADCDTYNRNPNACLTEWQEFVWDELRPAAICGLLLAFLMVATSILTVVLCVLKRKATANAAGRRSHRKDPHAPVRALTNRERNQLKNEFTKADKNSSGTLEGQEVLAFVNAVFPGDTIALDEAEALIAGRPKTFDEILNAYFPYLRKQAADPKLLTQKEAENATNVVDLHRRKLAKLDRFVDAAGALSPDALETIYTKYRNMSTAATNGQSAAASAGALTVPEDTEMSPLGTYATPTPKDEDGDGVDDLDADAMLVEIKQAAKALAQTPEGQMLKALSPQETEGLRIAWKNLHPMLYGFLTDVEIDRYYQWSHEAVLESREHFVRWKQLLDVRGTGRIEWPEFCFPYSQRAALKTAKEYLRQAGKDVAIPGAFLNKQAVVADYGDECASKVFLPYEKEVPIERVVATSLSMLSPV